MKTLVERLSCLGIKHRGNLGIKGRESFTALEKLHEHNLYACILGDLALRNHLTVRDVLRADSVLCKQYGELKFELSEKISE